VLDTSIHGRKRIAQLLLDVLREISDRLREIVQNGMHARTQEVDVGWRGNHSVVLEEAFLQFWFVIKDSISLPPLYPLSISLLLPFSL
jgi:hypothetical protein